MKIYIVFSYNKIDWEERGKMNETYHYAFLQEKNAQAFIEKRKKNEGPFGFFIREETLDD